jgi:ATP-dependent Clp protease ATP-binding subunit ClpC
LESVNYVEYKYNVFYPYQTLKKIVELSARYIHEVPFPEKALRLLEESAVGLQGEKIKIVTPAEIESLVSKRTNVPIGQVGEKEKDRLLNLESILHQRVIGQDEAINAVANALRRVRSGLTTGKRPAGVFLFLGPTGVGKTETAKALAESYFGSEKNMIRLDMSEYEQPDSLDRLIGTVQNPAGILTDAILAKPFSLILLDELEKADKNVLNIFLQVFEDGRLTDPRGKVSDFTNSIIIGTSNAGSEFIRENVGRLSAEQLKTTLIDQLQKQAIFTPEFLNRFDGVITFKPLTRENLTLVAGLMIGEINKQLEERKIRVEVESAALAKLIELGYNQEFGARPLRRVMEEKIENLLAKKMLEGVIKEHGVLHVSLSDIS